MITFTGPLQLAWRQLLHARTRFIVAICGVSVAVLLMLVQLGLRESAYNASLEFPSRLRASIIIVGSRTVNLTRIAPVSKRLVYRALAVPGVVGITPVYFQAAQWKNPVTRVENPIRVYGFDISENLLGLEPTFDPLSVSRYADTAVFDRSSRDRFGPVKETITAGASFPVEINSRRIEVTGLTKAGATLDQDGSIFTSEANFLRLFPGRDAGAIEIGVVKLAPNADATVVAQNIRTMLGREAQVMTKAELLDREREYLRTQAPVDFIFLLGAMVGFFVGSVVIYQILYTDVTNNLPQYATMKAIGFHDFYLMAAVIFESLIMTVCGYIPGFAGAAALYKVAARALEMPVVMTFQRGATVLGLTALMCCGAALIVMQKLRRSDPADVF